MATVRVEIEWPPDRGGAGAVAFVRVEDVSFLDAGAVTVAEQVLGDLDAAPEVVLLPVGGIDPRHDYTVRVHVSRTGSSEVAVGDLVSVASHPVLTRGFGDSVRVGLQVVR